MADLVMDFSSILAWQTSVLDAQLRPLARRVQPLCVMRVCVRACVPVRCGLSRRGCVERCGVDIPDVACLSQLWEGHALFTNRIGVNSKSRNITNPTCPLCVPAPRLPTTTTEV